MLLQHHETSESAQPEASHVYESTAFDAADIVGILVVPTIQLCRSF
jgi:hypothetical protein